VESLLVSAGFGSCSAALTMMVGNAGPREDVPASFDDGSVALVGPLLCSSSVCSGMAPAWAASWPSARWGLRRAASPSVPAGVGHAAGVADPGVQDADVASPEPARGGADVRSDVVLVVDAANVVGARPDGWWRDRAGAARRLLDQLERLVGRTVRGADGGEVQVVAVAVVLEGRARSAHGDGRELPPGLRVLLAAGSGDDAVVEVVEQLNGQMGAVDAEVVVVTADRGLRARLPARSWGPVWLRDHLDALDERGG